MKIHIRLSVLFMALALVFLLTGCGNQQKTNPPRAVQKPAHRPRAQARTAKPMQMQKQARRAKAGRLALLKKAAKDIEKYESTEQSCTDFCKSWCPKAAECKLSAAGEAEGCKKICFEPCIKGRLPKVLGQCLKKAQGCEKVKGCFADYRAALAEKRKEVIAKLRSTAPGSPAPDAPGQNPAGAAPGK